MNNTLSSLKDFNDEEFDRSLLTIVYLTIVLIIGVPGNVIVIVIYWKSFRKYVYKYIVWNLAVADLTFCTLGIPFNIARLVHFYTFAADWACKVFVGLINCGIIYSANLLILLSLHRFRQICMPTSTQFTVTNVRFWVIGCFVFASVIALPQFVLEKTEYVVLGYNITGESCPITSSHPSTYWVVRSSVLLGLFSLYTVALVVIYTLIGRNLCVHRQVRFQRQNSSNSVLGRAEVGRQMTKIAFSISVLFVLSYFPLFILKATSQMMDKSKISLFGHSMLRMVERFYFLNHVANPLIYLIFDSSFRKLVTLLAAFKMPSDSSSGDFSDRHIQTSSTPNDMLSRTEESRVKSSRAKSTLDSVDPATISTLLRNARIHSDLV